MAVDVVAPDGLILTAQYPAPTSAGVATTYEKAIGCVLGCFLQNAPGRSMAGAGNISNFVLGGFDSRPDQNTEFLMYEWTAGGYGGRAGKRDNHSAISLLASGTRNQPIERMERAYPVLFDGYGFIPDSPGPGRHRGGLGIYRSFHVTNGDGILSSVGDRELIPAWGAAGGRSANVGDGMEYTPKDGPTQVLGVKCSGFQVQDGSHLRYWEGGGGGFGPPWERPADWVLEDVRNGYVSAGAARTDYAVVVDVVDDDFVVDESATSALREAAAADAVLHESNANNGKVG
jgi:N-methylhydantoinase B